MTLLRLALLRLTLNHPDLYLGIEMSMPYVTKERNCCFKMFLTLFSTFLMP